MKRKDITHHMPPGMNWREERNFYVFGLCAAFIYSLLFFIRFSNALSNLYGWDNVALKRVLIPDAEMEDFCVLFRETDRGFLILALCMIGVCIWHYLYHWRGSKSIYLMRRLPHRFEIHRRCLTLPLCGAVIACAAAAAILLLYFGIYMLFTPAECLTDGQWMKIWRG